MIKRDVESPTAFAMMIKKECNIYDLQGLCKNRNNEYTIAVEAIDMGNDPVEAYIEIFSEQEIFAKARLASRVGASFVLMLHKKTGEKDEVFLKTFQAVLESSKVECVESNRLTSDYFINWWKARQCRVQHKQYREEMKRKINASYFDQLLETNGSSWSGNIDGFTMEKDANGIEDISSIIECRFTTDLNLEDYDPNMYFKNGGGDYMTWSGLIELARRIEVPLYLFTYSRKIGSREKVGLARVVDVNATDGLVYAYGIKPGENLKTTSTEVLEWMAKI